MLLFLESDTIMMTVRELRKEKRARQSSLEVGGEYDPSRILLVPVETDVQRRAACMIVENHHSYRPKFTCQGRRIDILVYGGERVIGCIGFSDQGTVLLPYAYRRWIGLYTLRELVVGVQYSLNNYRFTMIERNLGGKVLSLATKLLPRFWLERHGMVVCSVMTLVKPPWEGVVYKSAGWSMLGWTGGDANFHYTDRSGGEVQTQSVFSEKLRMFGRWMPDWDRGKFLRLVTSTLKERENHAKVPEVRTVVRERIERQVTL